ncbi:LysE family transporter [Moorella naiadis]|uniref:LysE family transporter n=1 Tax=Moorella naiadis (nom. illeg.) TaxID=3093670 RepID=UPI003D9CB452
MELLALFSTAFLVGLSGALMPGPLLTVTIEESTRRGAGAGPLLVLGHGLLELLLVGLLLFGLGGFLARPLVGRLVAALGGLVLLWMGWQMLRGATTGAVQLQLAGEETAALSPARPVWQAVVTGSVISLANPYWLLWWASIGAAFLAQAARLGAGGVTSFFSGHILADLGWYSLIAIGVAAGRRFISQRLYQYLIMGCGIFLLILGALFILAGYRGPLNV